MKGRPSSGVADVARVAVVVVVDGVGVVDG